MLLLESLECTILVDVDVVGTTVPTKATMFQVTTVMARAWHCEARNCTKHTRNKLNPGLWNLGSFRPIQPQKPRQLGLDLLQLLL